ncbi:MAG: hypothetical protein Q7K20_09115, partial [Polaromonas sp.]|nr:hypothetical protein [Polaromonas sp.]
MTRTITKKAAPQTTKGVRGGWQPCQRASNPLMALALIKLELGSFNHLLVDLVLGLDLRCKLLW